MHDEVGSVERIAHTPLSQQSLPLLDPPPDHTPPTRAHGTHTTPHRTARRPTTRRRKARDARYERHVRQGHEFGACTDGQTGGRERERERERERDTHTPTHAHVHAHPHADRPTIMRTRAQYRSTYMSVHELRSVPSDAEGASVGHRVYTPCGIKSPFPSPCDNGASRRACRESIVPGDKVM
jgi:hypothetical protein